MKGEKSPAYIEDVVIKTARDIFLNFGEFAGGFRVLFLIHRHKEGGATNNTKVRKIITRNVDEWKSAVLILEKEKVESESPLRVYASVNERNFKKAIRQFKFEQLEADYYDTEQMENFYLDVKNRFIGCLMQPQQRATSYFIFDCDNEDGRDVQGEALKVIPNEHIVKVYRTKNGWHIVTNAFNYTKLVLPKGVEHKKDGLLLISF